MRLAKRSRLSADVSCQKQMYRLIFILAVFLAGCGQRLDQLLDKLAGNHSQTVVLAGSPTTIDSESVAFKSEESMKVLGEVAGVCVVLKSGVAMEAQPIMDQQFKDALGDAALSGTVRVSNGQSFDLGSVGQSWRKYGVVTDAEETAACLSCDCGPKPPVGSEISEVVLRASSPVRVLGIYWESTDAFDSVPKSN
jgi:hypothetical protein